ncbi:DUF6468 domain-containing protein [Breoghania sp.]|uniref:DUF6468 domain-containing protein n=1 Tax=Breoghania sp. TaxID=2065378 RepID=UPI0029CA5242|nr:DUF6468 domain-containing protein [Breoghania sp.]
MTQLPLGLVIEGLVACLLVLTIAYCAVLNSRLKRLRSDEEALRATISELITTTEIAERAILGLKTTAAECDQTIGQRMAQAERLSMELASQLETGGTVLSRISQIAEAAGHGQSIRASGVDAGMASCAPNAAPAASQPQAQPTRSVSAQDLRAAAAEAAARLERFRQRNGERAA